MKIGIIGSGNIGGTLTRRLQALGHDVTVGNSRRPETLAPLAAETGATAGTARQAAESGDLVVIATPVRAVPDLPAEALRGKVVVDANNYYPQRDGGIGPLDDGSATSSRWTAERLAGATVVKAFNTIQAGHLLADGRHTGDPARVALPVAADDADAKRTVMGLVEELGFDPIDGGGHPWLPRSGCTRVYVADLDASGVRDGLAAARR